MKRKELNCSEAILTILQKKMKVLIVDDNPKVSTLLESYLDSPLIQCFGARSIEFARDLLKEGTEKWHCWIIDLDLGHNASGIDLIREHNEYAFIIVLSGLQDVYTGSQLYRMGILNVFDKSKDLFSGSFQSEVYRTCILGYMLPCCPRELLKPFILLKEYPVETIHQWSEIGCIGLRQLEKLCFTSIGLSPRYVLPLYYVLADLIGTLQGDSDKEENGIAEQKAAGEPHPRISLFKQFVDCHFSTRYRPWLLRHSLGSEVQFRTHERILAEEGVRQ